MADGPDPLAGTVSIVENLGAAAPVTIEVATHGAVELLR